MKITQLSMFLENKKGRLYDATKVLGDANIDIKALNIAESEDFGILRIVVDQPNAALKILKDNGFVASITKIVGVEVNDKPGGLSAVLKILKDNDLNIEYMYAFEEKNNNKAILILRFDNTDKAVEVLTKNNIRIIGTENIQGV